MRAADLARLPQPPADHVIAYGEAKQQFAELRLPKGPGPHPVVIVIHGGCWQTPWALDDVRGLLAAVLEAPGGVALGHSAGGHLALWLAARHKLPRDSELRTDSPLSLQGIVSLAGIPDLRAAAAAKVCRDAVAQLLGGSPTDQEGRVRQSSPIELVPLGLRQRVVCGALDNLVPSDLSRRYQEAASKAGDDVGLEMVGGVGHFELVDPTSLAWPAVRRAVADLLR